MKRAALYIRVSSKDQLEGYSLDYQKAAGLAFITEKGWTLAETYVDRAETARTARRHDFQRLLAELDEKRINYLVVHKSDRFARNFLDHFVTKEVLKSHGVGLVSITEHFEDTPTGRYFEAMIAAQNQLYSDNLSVEVTKGMVQKARSGLWPTRAPIGYVNVRRDGVRRAEALIEPDPVQASLVREALDLYSTGSHSINSVLEVMTERGLRNKVGRPLYPSTMHDIFCNPVYAGKVVWRGEVHEGVHEPLVSEGTFDRVQEVLRLHRQAEVRTRLHPHYLRGSLFCHSCGSRVSDMLVKKKTHRYCFCLGRHRRRTDCTEPFIPVELIENEVESIWWQVQLTEAQKRQIREDLAQEIEFRTGDPVQRDTAKLRIEELEKERRHLLRLALRGAVPEELVREEQERIASEIEAMEAVVRPEGDLSQLPDILELMFELIEDLPGLYLGAQGNVERRSLNQAVFKGFWVGEKQVRRYEYQPAYACLLEAESLNRKALVERSGFEPPTSSVRGRRSPS